MSHSTIAVSGKTKDRFLDYKWRIRAKSQDEALSKLLDMAEATETVLPKKEPELEVLS